MKTQEQYKVTINGQEYIVPERIREAIDRYVNHGILPGSFLQAVLANKLKESIGRADSENLLNLPGIVHYIHWEVPSICCGSDDAIKKWVESRRSK